jgi:hypothetical protein
MKLSAKPGDLVRNKNSESGMIGLFIRWREFYSNENDHRAGSVRFPEVRWSDGRTSTIQYNLLEIESAACKK